MLTPNPLGSASTDRGFELLLGAVPPSRLGRWALWGVAGLASDGEGMAAWRLGCHSVDVKKILGGDPARRHHAAPPDVGCFGDQPTANCGLSF